jgi:DNA adenine methylase
MKYMGSKSRIAKYIIPVIHQRMKDYSIHTYVEPFVGGANVIDKVIAEKRIGCDKQKYLIALYQNLDKINTLPDFITKEHYSMVRDCYNRNLNTFEDWYIGAIGFLASYNGRFFDGGYAGLVKTKAGTVRDYYAEAKRNLEKQIDSLQGIQWKQGDYRTTCSDYEGCLIYCDPPYFNTTQYGISQDFNYGEFWDWCREMSERNIVLVSEYTAREDFQVIWEMPIKRTIGNAKRIETVERLFELNEYAI